MKNIIHVLILLSFSLSVNSQCQDSVYVTGHTIDAGLSGFNYQWYRDCSSFGAAIPISGATQRTYTPTLFGWDYSVVVSSPNCSDTSVCVFIDSNCMAYFRPTQTTAGQIILLDSSFAAGNIDQYTWNFGDGNVSSLQYPTHNYTNPGTYQITLFISDSSRNCSNFYHDTITVDSSGILRGGFSLSVIKAGTLGVNENEEFSNVNLFPNPTSDILNIQFEKVQESNVIQLIDLSGKLIYSETINNKEFVTINTQSIVAGVYIVRMRNQSGERNMKLIIQ